MPFTCLLLADCLEEIAPLAAMGGWKTFQNLKVSSAAALATVVPSGLRARCRTLLVWPLRSAIFFMVGYFQIVS